MSKEVAGTRIKIKSGAIWALLLAACLVALDQGTKYLAAAFLKPVLRVSLIPHVLELRYLENRGAAFGMLQNRQWVFVIFAFAIVFGCGIEYRRMPGRRFLPLRICLVVLASGAAGNLIDRVSRGYVVDFLYVSAIDFPIFNVADICVTLSVIALILLVLFRYREDDFSSGPEGEA